MSSTEAPGKKRPPPPLPAEKPPLLDGWEKHIDDSSGEPYYHHNATGVASWERPAPNIFFNGLPELGPISETNLTSKPSVPTDEQHKKAYITVKSFSTLSNWVPKLPPRSTLWNCYQPEDGHLGGYSNEDGVSFNVKLVIKDVLDYMGVKGEVRIREEVEIMRNRPDFMLILVNGHPIGTIEGKQPGLEAMTNPNILGEVYDQLVHLHSIFRVDHPFAILTSYEQWRICWLNDNSRAQLTELPVSDPFLTPVKSTGESKSGGEHSPPLPQTPSRQQGVGKLQNDNDSDSDEILNFDDDENREFCGTDVIEWTDGTLPRVLVSVIEKMIVSKQLLDTEPTVLRLANATTSAWKKAPDRNSLNFGLCIGKSVKNFFLWEDLGTGADGRAFLVSGGTKRAVGVLKFFHRDAERKASHEEGMWKTAYSHLAPVSSLRMVTVMGATALLMPWFQAPKRTKQELAAVNLTLTEDFKNRGLCHDDVAWRNVGIYEENGKMKAVVFDMQRVSPIASQEDWVTNAVESLSKKLG